MKFMNSVKSKFILSMLICLLGTVALMAQDTKNTKEVKGKYQNIEVGSFDIKSGVEFPPDSLKVMMPEIVDELKKLKKFKQVSSEGETKTETTDATIRLSGTITKYKPGNRTARYLVGFGAGAAKVVAHVKFTDSTTGEVLFEKDVDGKVIMGVFGGDSNGATRGLAKEVAEVAKKKFF